jgi:hypothetical protein
MIEKHQLNIKGFIRKVYYAYFGVKLGDQHKSWAPHKVCYVCVEDRRKWSKGKKKSFRFGIPIISREPKNYQPPDTSHRKLHSTRSSPATQKVYP